MMVKMMDKAGYSRPYAAALTASIEHVGPIIPPSVSMIIYALQDENVSVGGLFMAGFIPGILIVLAMAAVNWWVCKKRDYRSTEPRPLGARDVEHQLQGHPRTDAHRAHRGRYPLRHLHTHGSLPSWPCSMHWSAANGSTARSSGRPCPASWARSAMLTASVLLVMATSAAFAWVLTVEGIPAVSVRADRELGTLARHVPDCREHSAAGLRHLHGATARRDDSGAYSCAHRLQPASIPRTSPWW